MLCDPAPCGRGAERLFVKQRAGGLGSTLVSAGDFHAQCRSTAA